MIGLPSSFSFDSVIIIIIIIIIIIATNDGRSNCSLPHKYSLGLHTGLHYICDLFTEDWVTEGVCLVWNRVDLSYSLLFHGCTNYNHLGLS